MINTQPHDVRRTSRATRRSGRSSRIAAGGRATGCRWNHTFGSNQHTSTWCCETGGTFYVDRRQAGAGPDRERRSRNLRKSRRRCTSTCRAASTCCCRTSSKDARAARELLPRPRSDLLRRRRRCRRTSGSRIKKLATPSAVASSAMLRLGLDGDGADGDLRALSDRCAWRDRAACAPDCEIKLVPSAASSKCACAGRTSRRATIEATDLTARRVRRGRASTASATRCACADPERP